MSEFNMNNQYDQKSETTAHYIGRIFAEYSMIYMEAEEETKNFLVGVCDSIMGLMPDWVKPVLEVTNEFFGFVLDAMDASAQRLQGAILCTIIALPIIANPRAMEVALAGGGTTGFSTGAVVMFAGLLAVNGGGGSGGGNNEKETFSERSSGGGKKSEKPEKVEYGDHYASKRPKKLKANVEYTDSNGYTYTTDSQGRISSARGTIDEVDPKTPRNQYAQSHVGKGDGRLPDDDGGHLFGTLFKGSKEIDNLLPQNSNLNRGKWKEMENKWGAAVEDGKKVDVDIKVNYGKDGRPTSYDVKYKIEGNKSVNENFKNESSK